MTAGLSGVLDWRAVTAKGFREGTHRLVSPAETLARVRPLLPVMGITRIANVTGLDTIGIPVVMVCRPNARALSVAQGKGLSLDAARASGVMEAIEAYHAERITLPLKLASYEELRYTHQLIEPHSLPRLPHQLFDPHVPIHWIEGFDLLEQRSVWLPYDTVHLNCTVAMQRSAAGFVVSSNGLSSGNHLLEAISHGICEVVERDAATLWALAGPQAQAASRLDLASIADPACQAVLQRYHAAGVAVGLWEITSDIGIPAFLCRIVDAVDQPHHRLYHSEAMGCHPTREVALLRALTEAAQVRLTWITGARDDARPDQYLWGRNADLMARQRAELLVAAGARPLTAAPTWQADSFEQDLVWELAQLHAAGIRQVVVVNLTRVEFGLPVVKVVIPGLEGLWSHGSYSPGPRASRHARGRA